METNQPFLSGHVLESGFPEDPKEIPKKPKFFSASSVPAPQKSPDPNRKGSSSNRLVFRGVHFIREATASGQLAVCLVGEIVKIPPITKKDPNF